MTPNRNCMKNILNFISENIKVQVEDIPYRNITINTINVSTLLNQMSKEGKYTIEEIAYNFLQCYYNDFVNANINFQQNMIQSSTSDILGITFDGIDFMNQN